MRVEDQVDFQISYKFRPNFSDHVREYTSRSLSFDTDGLNAFKGMLASQRYHSYWGVPFVLAIATRPTAREIQLSFCKGLLWFRKNFSRDKRTVYRRGGFPTWSWSGLVATAECASDNSIWSQLQLAVISVEDSHGKARSIVDLFERKRNEGRVIPELSPYLHVTGYMAKVGLEACADTDTYSAYPADDSLENGTGNSVLPRAEVIVDILTDESLIPRLEQETWNAIALLGGFSPKWLLLDWRGSTAYRIGRITGFATQAS